MKKWIVFSLIVVLLLIIGCGNIYKKTRVSIKDINDDYIYVAEIEDGTVAYHTYNIERDDKLKEEALRVGDILEIEYQVKEQAIVPIIKLKSFKLLIDDTHIKAQVIIKNMSINYIYVAEIKSEEVTRIMYNIERDDKLKKEKLSIGDILEIEYQVKERSKPPLIKLKSFKVLPQE